MQNANTNTNKNDTTQIYGMDTAKMKLDEIMRVKRDDSQDGGRKGVNFGDSGGMSRDEIMKLQSKLTREQLRQQKQKIRMDREKAMELAKDYRVIQAKKQAKENLRQYVQDWKRVTAGSAKTEAELKAIKDRFDNQDIESVMTSGIKAESGAVAARTIAEQKSQEMENALKQMRERFTGDDSDNDNRNEIDSSNIVSFIKNKKYSRAEELSLINEALPNLGELLVNRDTNKIFFEKKLPVLLESKHLDEKKKGEIVKLVKGFNTVGSHVGYHVKTKHDTDE